MCLCVRARVCARARTHIHVQDLISTARVRQSFLTVRFTGMTVKLRVTVKCIIIKKEMNKIK